MEFEGFVTQLASGSEVASIGLNLQCPKGSLLKVEGFIIAISSQGAARTVDMRLLNSNGSVLSQQVNDDMNSTFMSIAEATLSNVGVAAHVNKNNYGFKLPIVLGSEMRIQALCTNTLVFSTTLTFRFYYWSRNGVIPAITAAGTGITLTTTSHKQI